MADDIIQKISLSGDSDIVSAFSRISSAGTDAFKAIEEASAGEIFAGVALGIAAVAAALGVFAKSAADSVTEMSHLAEQAGTTLETMSAMTTVLTGMGANTEDLSTGFKRLAVRLETDWPAIAKASSEAADQMAGDSLKIAEGYQKIENAQNHLVSIGSKAFEASEASAKSMEHAIMSVHDAQIKLNDLQGKPQTQAEKNIDNLAKAHLAVKDAIEKVAEINQKSADADAKYTQDMINGVLALRKAREEASKEQEKQDAAAMKNPALIGEALQGVKQKFELADVAAKDVLKGIEYNAGKAAAAARGLGESIFKPTEIQVIYAMADAMKNAGSATERTAIAAQAFGRGIRQDIIHAMTEAGPEFEKLVENVKKSGLALTNDMSEPAQKLHNQFTGLADSFGKLFDKIGLAIGTSAVFQAAMTGITYAVGSLEAAFAKVDQPGLLHNLVSGLAECRDAVGWVIGKVVELGEWAAKSFDPRLVTALGVAITGITILLMAFIAPWAVIPIAIALVATAIGAVRDHMDEIKAKLKELVTAVGAWWDAFTPWENIKQNLINGWQSIVDWINKAIEAVKSFFGAKGSSSSSDSSSLPGHAAGGPIRGPGNGTSDSILGWLSDGEFVVRADGSNLIDAMNHFGANLMGFAMGGLVPAPVKMAEGGKISASHILNLTIGSDTFEGLKATDDVAARLQRFAISSQIATTGRKPSWLR